MLELSSHQISEQRQKLIDQRQELEAQLRQSDFATKPVTLDQQSVGRVSRIDAIQQQQMALAGQQQATQLRLKIDAALQRIDSGTYGYCLECDELIPFPRLQAQPFAELCIDCQSANETNG